MADTATIEGLFLGLMSGTSLDGIDCALCEITANSIILKGRYLHPWPTDLRQRLTSLIESPSSISELLELSTLCAVTFSDAATTCLSLNHTRADEVIAIGSHGQTVRHSPDTTPAYTLQIGNPSVIAEYTGITTVSDFRSRDIAAGGQGAPLVPAFHRQLLNTPGQARAILNIGGIANLTILNDETAVGFDTGPGNRLLDDWCQLQTGRPYDRSGEWAATGRVNTELLTLLRQDAYFAKPPPKSTGTDYFNLVWLEGKLASIPAIVPEDVQATLSELTAVSIAEQIRLNTRELDELLVCGGGWHNTDLIKRLANHLQDIRVVSTEEYGIDPDWMEAMAFAWLAYRTLNGLPGNLPTVTGAKAERILGTVCYR